MIPSARSDHPVARLVRTVIGALLVVVGVVLLVLPGPGLLLIAAGLSVLAIDHHWAHGLLARAKKALHDAKTRTGR